MRDENRILIPFAIVILLFFAAKACEPSLPRYDHAWIELPGGETVAGRVEDWVDVGDSQLRVKIDCVTYLTDTTRCVLAKGEIEE